MLLLITNNIECISVYLSIKNIILLASTNKNCYNNKRNLIIFSLSNRYKELNNSILESCSFKLYLFEVKNLKQKIYLDLNKNDIVDEKIIATYKVFKFAEETNITKQNDIFIYNIPNQLIDYFDEIYKIKYRY